MQRYFVLFLMLFLVSCCTDKNLENEKSKMITGEIGVFTLTEYDIGAQVIAGDSKHSFGAISPKGGAIMGFAQFSVNDKLEVLWKEEYPDGSVKEHVAAFDTKLLADESSKIKGLKFTYLGNQAWKLDVFKAPQMQTLDLLNTINNVEPKR